MGPWRTPLVPASPSGWMISGSGVTPSAVLVMLGQLRTEPPELWLG